MEPAMQYKPQVRRLSNASSILDDIFGHPDLGEEDLLRRIKQADKQRTPKNLADFLRNTPPPPNNFMSFPERYDSTAEEDQARWKRGWFKVFSKGKKTSKMRPPRTQPIQLPDSAVSDKTVDGHRHIAISIPIEHANLDLQANTSGAVPPSTSLPRKRNASRSERSAEARSTRSSSRAPSVLNPVVEVRESAETMKHAGRQSVKHGTREFPVVRRPSNRTIEEPPTRPSSSRRKMSTGRPGRSYQDEAQVKLSADIPLKGTEERHHRSNPRSPASSSSLRERRQCARNSSEEDVHQPRVSSDSAYAVSKNSITKTDTSPVHESNGLAEDANTFQDHGFSLNRSSVLSHAGTVIYNPVRTLSQKEIGFRGSRLALGTGHRSKGSDASLHFVDVPSRTPSNSNATIWATQQLGLMLAADQGSEAFGSITSEVEQLKMVPFMVVADVEPASESCPPPLHVSKKQSTHYKEPPQTAGLSALGSSSHQPLDAMSPDSSHSAYYTPPASPHRSDEEDAIPPSFGPSRANRLGSVSLDHINLHRRHDSFEPPKLRIPETALARAEFDVPSRQQTITQRVHENVRPRSRKGSRAEASQSVVRRNEASPESRGNDRDYDRDRDIEARLARLEQNGDVWLTAMVPLFEKLNQSLARIHEQDQRYLEPAHTAQATWEELKAQQIPDTDRHHRRHRSRQSRPQTSQTERHHRHHDHGAYDMSSERDTVRHVSLDQRSQRSHRSRHPLADARSEQRAIFTPKSERRKRATSSVKSPLQERFENEHAQRRRQEELDAAVDARIAELAAQAGGSYRPGRHDSGGNASWVDLGGFIDDGESATPDNSNSLDALEPLMRELMSGARPSASKPANAPRTPRSPTIAERGELKQSENYLFEGF